MAIKRKVFDLGKHPTKGQQQIVVERHDPISVWHLVITNEKAIPLPGLKNPTAKKVLDALAKQCGDTAVVQFLTKGYSPL